MKKTAREVIEDISSNAFQVLSRDDKGGLAKLIEAKLEAAGFVIVPKEPTKEMVEAGTAADWVGEVESRQGLSILPDTYMYFDGENDREISRPGIWAAMICAAKD